MEWFGIIYLVLGIYVEYMCYKTKSALSFRTYIDSVEDEKLRHFEGDKREFIDNYGLEAYFDLLRTKEEPQRTKIPDFTKGGLVPPNIDNPTDNDRVGF